MQNSERDMGALVIVSSIFVLNAVKGKAKNDSAIDKSLTAVDSVLSEEGWLVSSPSVPVIPSAPAITFPDPGNKPEIDANGEMTEQKIKDYLASNNVEIKDIDGNPATNYTIENIVKVESFVQFDVVVGGDRGGMIEKVMVPSFSFAHSLPAFYGYYYIIYGSTSSSDLILYSSTSSIKLRNIESQIYEKWLYTDGSWVLDRPSKSSVYFFVPGDFLNNTLISSNHDIYDLGTNPSTVFFPHP